MVVEGFFVLFFFTLYTSRASFSSSTLKEIKKGRKWPCWRKAQYCSWTSCSLYLKCLKTQELQRQLQRNTLLNDFWSLSGVLEAGTEKYSILNSEFQQTHVKPKKWKSIDFAALHLFAKVRQLLRTSLEVLKGPPSHRPKDQLCFTVRSLPCFPLIGLNSGDLEKVFHKKTWARHPPLSCHIANFSSTSCNTKTFREKPQFQVGNHPATDSLLRKWGIFLLSAWAKIW